jgi:hypothetical protein
MVRRWCYVGMSDPTRRTFHPEIKIVSKAEGTVDYIASDETIDAHREIVKAKGWRFNRFAKNAPFVDSHDYWSIDKMLGRVVSYELKGGKLVERVKWAIDVPDAKLARLGFDLTEAGYLKAVSVGFIPTRFTYQGCDDFADVVKEMGLTAEDAVKVRCIYLEQEQIELSACIIGSNPNALAKAFHDGVVKEDVMASLGFKSEAELTFLQRAALAYDGLDPVQRGMVDNEFLRIYRARNLSGKATPPASTAGKPDGADEATRLAEEDLAEISKRLEALATGQKA